MEWHQRKVVTTHREWKPGISLESGLGGRGSPTNAWWPILVALSPKKNQEATSIWAYHSWGEN